MVALEVKQQEIPFAVGLDEADDPQGAPAGFLRAENVIWNKDRVMDKRGGFVSVARNTENNNVALVASGPQLGIVRTDGIQALSDVDTTLPLNPAPFTGETSIGTYYTGRSVFSTDLAALVNDAGVRVLCLVTTTYDSQSVTYPNREDGYDVYVQFIDAATGATVQELKVDGSRLHGRVTTVFDADLDKDVFMVTSVRATGISGAALACVNTYDPDTFEEVSAGIDLFATDNQFDGGICTDLERWEGDGRRAVFAYRKPDGTIGLALLNYDATVLDQYSGAELADAPIALAQAGNFVFVTAVVGSDIVVLRFGGGFAPLGHVVVSPLDGYELSISAAGTEFFQVVLVINRLQPDFVSTLAWLYTIDSVELISDPIGTLRNTYVITKPWVDADGNAFVAAIPGNAPQDPGNFGTGMILRLPLFPGDVTATVGQVCYDECGSVPYLAGKPMILQIASVVVPSVDPLTVFVPVVVALGPAGADDHVPVNRARISLVRFAVPADIPTTLQLDGVGYVPGSAPMLFDGFAGNSMTFFETPVLPTCEVHMGGGSLAAATYAYRVLWEAYDSHGNLRVSMPSLPTVVDVAASGSVLVTVWMPAHGLTFSQELLWKGKWRAKVYRASTVATTYHLIWSSIPTSLIDTETYETFLDIRSDTDIAAYEILKYTDGFVLQSEPAPPIAYLWAHRNRLFAIRSDVPETVGYTKEITAPNLPEWNAVLSLRVDNSGGAPYAGASLQDKCLIFQRDQIVVVNGFGPDENGNPPVGAFSQPEVVALGHGTIEPASVVQTPAGIMFRHSTGIKMIDPGMQVAEIGRPIEDTLGGARIVRARYLPKLHQVWVLTDAAEFQVLVYDVRYSRWSVFTSPGSEAPMPQLLDVLEVDGTVYALSARYLFVYDLAATQDIVQGSVLGYDMRLLTPWIRGDRAQQLRCYKVHFSGTAFDLVDAQVTLEVYTQRARVYDHDSDAPDNAFTWDATQLATTPPGAFTLSTRLITERCEAFRIGVTVAGPGRTCRPATLTLDFGVIQSRGKVPVGKRPVASLP